MRVHRAASWLLFVAAPALASVGCPPHELRIAITPGGAEAVVTSCNQATDDCRDGAAANESCCNTPLTFDDVLLRLENLAFQIVLLDRRNDEVALGTRSPCLPLRVGCLALGTEKEQSQCFADAVNRAMNDGLGELSFDGMDPEHVDVGLALYAGPDREATCNADEVFACALLVRPTGAETYDILCANCTGHAPLESAPVNAGGSLCANRCFVVDCHRFLGGQAT